jgi:hypothetical protein
VNEPLPTLEDCRSDAEAFFAFALKDPHPEVRWPNALAKGYVTRNNVPLFGIKGGIAYGWAYIVQVNARNGFGGYTGWLPWTFLWSEGSRRAVIGPEYLGGTYRSTVFVLDEQWFLEHRHTEGGRIP